MANAIYLTATSDYETAGKQHIGRVTGPSPKWGTAIDFVGTRSGKRGDYTKVTVVDPGLYRIRNTTRKGNHDSYYLIWSLDERTLVKTEIYEEDALRLAKDLTPASISATGRRVEIADTEQLICDAAALDPEEIVNVERQVAAELGIQPGEVARRDLVAARRAFVDRMRGVVTPERPIELDGGPSDPDHRRATLLAERQQLLARLAEIDAEIAIGGPS
jgi:hypothetical protein